MKALTRFLSAPHRTAQITIWVLLLAVLAAVVPMSGGAPTALPNQAAPAAVSSPGPVPMAPLSLSAVTVASDSDAVTLADGKKLGTDDDSKVSRSVHEAVELLPAYRWHDDMGLHTDVGNSDIEKGLVSAMANLSFTMAGMVWWILLELMNFAMSMDIVSSFANSINKFFADTWTGVSAVGIPALIGIAVALLAAVAASKGKLNDGIRMMVSALIVLGLLQSLGTAASADTTSTVEGSSSSSAAPPKGTPAWLAVTGNKYVNEVAGQVSSLFGATNGLTEGVRTGSADGGAESVAGELSCTYYTQRLYAAYNAKEEATGSKSTAAAMSMVSYMWQRSVYDPWMQAQFGPISLAAPAACHKLERSAGISPATQMAVAGTATSGSPYNGMKAGPFTPASDKKPEQASQMAWSVCSTSSTFRGSWGAIEHFAGNGNSAEESCGNWFSATKGGGIAGESLQWGKRQNMHNDTTGRVPDDAGVADVRDFVDAYWGHNEGQRFLAGGTALLTAGLYTYAFGMPAIGVLMSQFVLLFMLILLPWTLVLLAMPTKDGRRGAIGVKLARMTGMALGGKLLFLVLLGVTLTLMSALYSLTLSGAADASYTPVAADGPVVLAAGAMSNNMVTFWSVLVPVVSIVAMKFLMKAAGMGNLMGLGGAMGFATAAVKQSKDGKWAPSKIGSNGSGAVGAGKKGVAGAKKLGGKVAGSRIGKKVGGSVRARQAAHAVNETKSWKNSKKNLDRDLADQVISGKLGVTDAQRQQRKRDKGMTLGKGKGAETMALPDDLAKRVASGEMTVGSARTLLRAKLARDAHDRAGMAQDPSGTPIEAAAEAVGATAGNALTDGKVFKKAGTKSTDEVEDDLLLRRAGMNVQSANAKNELEWHVKGTERLSAEGVLLMKNCRLDGSDDGLTMTQQLAATQAARAEAPPSLANTVLVGATGLPPVMLPNVDVHGRLTISDVDARDLETCLAVLSNPLNHVEPDAVARRSGEGDDAYHARLNLTLLETGLQDTAGNRADMLASLGVDRSQDGWEDVAMSMVQAMKSEGIASAFIENYRTVDAGQMDRIAGSTYQLVNTISTTERSTGAADPSGRLEQVAADSRDVSARAAASVAAIEDAVQRLNVSVTDPREFGKAMTSLLQQVESAAPAMINGALAVTMESHIMERRFAGEEPDIAAIVETARKKMIEEQSNIDQNITMLRLSGDTNRDELVAFGQQISATLKSYAAMQQGVLAETQEAARLQDTQAAAALSTQLENLRAHATVLPPPL